MPTKCHTIYATLCETESSQQLFTTCLLLACKRSTFRLLPFAKISNYKLLILFARTVDGKNHWCCFECADLMSTVILRMSTKMGDSCILNCEICKATKTKDGRPLHRCGGCGMKSYCSSECQKTHWVEGGHKVECKQSKKADKPKDVYEDLANRLKACPKDVETMSQVLHEIETLSINDANRDNRQKFAALGVATPLIQAATFHASKNRLIGHFFAVIGHLSQNDDIHAVLIRDNVLELITTSMKIYSDDADILGQALFAVAFLTLRTDPHVLTLFHAGGICEAILTALTAHRKQCGVAAWGCKSVVGLCKLPPAKLSLRERSGPALVLTALRSFPGERHVALYGLQALTNLISDVDTDATEVIMRTGSAYEKQLLTQGREFMKVNQELCELVGGHHQACEIVMTVLVANQQFEGVVKIGCNAVTFLLEVPANKQKLLTLRCKELFAKLMSRGKEEGMSKPYDTALSTVLLKLDDGICAQVEPTES